MHFNKMVERGKRMNYYIYGAGKNLKTILDQVSQYICIEGILDNDKNKINTKIFLKRIYSTEFFFTEMYDNHTMIIISVTNPKAQKEIEADLIKRGINKGENYILASEFCNLGGGAIPGTVSGVIRTPAGYEPRKSVDPNSYIVLSQENRIFRVIKDQVADKTRRIYEKCEENDLLDKWIVKTWIADNEQEFGTSLVLEHEYIPIISYCYEWSPRMYEDYVIYFLNLIEKITKVGLCLVDAHGLNATIYKGRFCFFDFGALDEGIITGARLQEVLNTLVLPLILIKVGQISRAYLYLEDHSILLSLRDVVGYLSSTESDCLKKIYEKTINMHTNADVLEILAEIRKYIINFRRSEEKGKWEDYQDGEWMLTNDKTKWTLKMQNAISLIESVKPYTIIDIAGNQGWYGSYFRQYLDSSIIVDSDVNALDKLWTRIKNEKINNVIPVKMSICAPSLGRHYDGFIDGKTIKSIRKCGCERYRSEFAIALSIVHHLAFREYLSFDEIISLLSEYTTKYLLIEFVDKEDKFIEDFIKVGYEWYTKDNFERSLKQQFNILQQKESSPKETRTMYLCEKNDRKI